MNTKKVKSYGIIPTYKEKEDYQVLIVKNSKGGHWGLPKGTPENNETPLQTAKRELVEETGITNIKILNKTLEETYSFEENNIIYNKKVLYFIGFTNEMKLSNNLDEIDEIKWINLNTVDKFLTHQSTIKLLKSLLSYLNSPT